MAQTRFVLGSGEYFVAKDDAQAQRMRDLGMSEATPEVIHSDELAKQYSSWMYAPGAAALGVASAVTPGLTGAVMSGVDAISHDQGKMMADYVQGVGAAWPKVTGAGQVAGALTPGGLAAGGSKLAQFGANAAGGAGMSFDDLALKHIQSPEGGEKIVAAVGLNALFAGVLGLGAGRAAKWLGEGNVGKIGAKLEAQATESLGGGAKTPFQTWMGDAAKNVGKYAGIGQAMGGGFVGGAASTVAGQAARSAFRSDTTAYAEKGLGKFIQHFDETVFDTVKLLLAKTGLNNSANLGGTTSKLLGLQDFAVASAGVKWTAENPTVAVPRTAEYMAKDGLPTQVADAATPQTIKAAQYLASMAPKSHYIGQTVAPTAWHPTLAQKAEFLDRVNAVNDPVWAMQNPNKARMEAVQAVYPVLAGKVATILAQEAAKRPDLSTSARRRIALLTGQIPSILSDPQVQATIAQFTAESEQPPARPGQGSSGSNMIQQTRLNRMSE